MILPPKIVDRHRLILLLSILLSAGFFATTLFGYFVSKQAIRTAIIGQDLPLTSSNIYSSIATALSVASSCQKRAGITTPARAFSRKSA